MSTADRSLVLAIGNVLLGDDGAGAEVLVELRRRAAALPLDCDLVDGGTAGLGLVPLVAGSRAVIVLDALDDGGAPGTVATVDTLPPGGIVGDIVATARILGPGPQTVALVGIRPARIEPGVGLSGPVRAAIPAAADAVTALLERLAHGSSPARSDATEAASRAVEAFA